MELVYIPIAILVALALDWAIFERIISSLQALFDIGEDFGYRNLLFPRVILTVASVIFVGTSQLNNPADTALFSTGIALFVLANLYAYYLIFRRAKRS